MRVYISGPIEGVKDFQKNFEDADYKLTNAGYDVVNPCDVAAALPCMEKREYMEIDFELLSKCGAIYMIEGWERSDGAKAEYAYAKALGLEILRGDLGKEAYGDGLVEIGEIVEGTTVEAGGIRMEILDIAYPAEGGGSGILCLAKDVLFRKAFDEGNCNNWEKSSLRKHLNGGFKDGMVDALGDDGDILAFRRDLTSDDGMKDYGECVDYISLLSCDEYRRYRKNISNKSNWWWTLTPWTCSASYSNYARLVFTAGTLDYYSAYGGLCSVAPAFLLSPSVRVEIAEDEK